MADRSPFATDLGRFMNMARIGLGEDRGWLELHQHGELALYSADDPDGRIFTFNAEDAELLIAVGQELAGRAEAWRQYQQEQTEDAVVRVDRGEPVEIKLPPVIIGRNGHNNQPPLGLASGAD